MLYAACWSRKHSEPHQVKHSLLLVTDGLISNQGGLTFHPDLFLWQRLLDKRKQQWFDCPTKNPLAMYAALLNVEPATLLASKLSLQGENQYWVASPYYAQLARDSVRVMSEGMLPWCAEDAIWACELLNPLLAEDGMQLHRIGAALLLVCNKPLDAKLMSFADIAGNFLPNRHPSGVDGGSFMRLMAEVQMMLKQSPAAHRRERGELDVHGLWFWGGSEPDCIEALANKSVATRNPFLQSVVDAQNANIIVTEAERLAELIKQDSVLPKRVVLLGEGYAVSLKKSLLAGFGTKAWLPRDIKSEADLLGYLKR